jgi:hypothetical protein
MVALIAAAVRPEFRWSPFADFADPLSATTITIWLKNLWSPVIQPPGRRVETMET